MAKNKPAGTPQLPDVPRRPATVAVLLVLTTIVAATGVWLLVRPPSEQARQPDGGSTPVSDERGDVLRNARNLIAQADELGGRPGAMDSPQATQLRDTAYRRARDLLLAYARTNPQDTEVRTVLAEAMIRTGQFESADKLIDSVLAEAPGSAEALWLKGARLQSRGDPNADEYFRRSANSPSAGPGIWARYAAQLVDQKKLPEAAQYYQRAYQAGSRQLPVLLGLAQWELAAGRADSAETILLEAVGPDRQSPRLRRMLADARLKLGHAEQAAEDLEAAVAASTGLDRAMMSIRLGQVRHQQKQWSRAAEAFDQAAVDLHRLWPGTPLEASADLQAAQCYYQSGQIAQAMKTIDRAAKSRPADAETLQWRKKIEDARFGPADPNRS